MSRLPWHFLPFTVPLPSLCSALPFPSKPPTHSPAHYRLQCWPGKVDYRENVINSMERKHRLSIIHVPLRCYLWLSLSPPTPSDLAVAGPLSSSPPLHAISVKVWHLSFIALPHAYAHTLKHTHIHHPTWMPEERRLSQLNPKYSDRLESSMVGAGRGWRVALQEMDSCMSTCRWLYK